MNCRLCVPEMNRVMDSDKARKGVLSILREAEAATLVIAVERTTLFCR